MTTRQTVREPHVVPSSITAEASAWLRVVLVWAGAVAVFALVMYLLARGQLEDLRAHELGAMADAFRTGNLKQAAMYQSDPTLMLWYPTSVVIQFALLGLAVIATASMGRRSIAIAIPFVVLAASFAPAYWGEGGLAPQPLGHYDNNLWAWLVSEPGMDKYAELPVWPLVLGSAVQVMLLLLPLVAAPAVKPLLSLSQVVARAIIPGLALAVLALALVPAPSADEIYRAPVLAIALAFFVTAITTGRGPVAVRLTAAVVIPAALTPIVLSTALDNNAQGVAFSAAAAAAAVVVLLFGFGLERLRSRLSANDSTDVVAAGV